MKKCSKCNESVFDEDKFCNHCGFSLDKPTLVIRKDNINYQSEKIIVLVAICLIVLFCVFVFSYEQNSFNQNGIDEEIVETNNENIENLSHSEKYTGNNCAVCGKPCILEKEVHSNGDAVSKYEPYYLCGENIDCVYERERQNKTLQQSEEVTYSSNEYSFESDEDVLRYLLGKTFRQKGGSGYIIFYSDGANLSGLKDYQWLSYETLGSFKGLVKLSSLDPNNPDGVLKLWVSCNDNAITDGSVVFLYN